MENKTIFIVEDHQLVSEGIKNLIESNSPYKIIGQSTNGLEALREILKINPDLVLSDISLPSMLGTELIKELRKNKYDGKVVMITRHSSIHKLIELLEIGIDGYILKEDSGQVILDALKKVFKGEQYFSEYIMQELENIKNSRNRIKHHDKVQAKDFKILTDQEKIVLKLVAEGKTTQEVSTLLNVSTETIKTHRKNLFKKLSVKNVAELVHYAIKYGVIE